MIIEIKYVSAAMSLYATPQIKLLFQKLEHTQARQEAAANNMSRAGIAGAKTKEVEDFKKAVRRGKNPNPMHTTNPTHLVGSVKQTTFKVKTSKEQADPSISGNTISGEQQLLALNEAGTDYYRLRQVNNNTLTRIRMIAALGGGK